jgi:hypothetical protein
VRVVIYRSRADILARAAARATIDRGYTHIVPDGRLVARDYSVPSVLFEC